MKGSVLDVIGVLFFITFIPLIFGLSVYLVQIMQGTVLNTNNYMDTAEETLESFDGFFYIAFFLMGLIAMVLASRVSVHPVFMGFAFLLTAIMIMFAATFSNLYLEIATNADLETGFEDFTLTEAVHQNTPIIITLFAILIIMLQYSKAGKEEIRTGV